MNNGNVTLLQTIKMVYLFQTQLTHDLSRGLKCPQIMLNRFNNIYFRDNIECAS
jgi:hypothetical protein